MELSVLLHLVRVSKSEKMLNIFFTNIFFSVGNIVFPTNVDQLESVSDEWMTSPLNKIPIRTSKLISEKPVRTRDYKKSLPDYYNLK